MMRLHRRLFVRAAAALFGAALAVGFATPAFAQDANANANAKKKVLFLTKSQGFQHSVVARKADNPSAPAHAERLLTEFAGAKGYDVTFTKDADVFNDPKTYDTYDVVAFYTTGDLTKPSDKYATKREGNRTVPDTSKLLHTEKAMSPEGKQMLIDAIRADKVGFIGFHCASDTFHSPNYGRADKELMYDASTGKPKQADPYINLVGGEFQSHGSQQKSNMKVVSKSFPGLTDLQDFTLNEEWYALVNLAPDLHVILAQDTATMKNNKGETEWQYARPNFPATWARKEGNGRVFYTSMGHREDVWENPTFQKIVLAGLDWASGKTQFDAKTNIKEATPDYQTAGTQAKK